MKNIFKFLGIAVLACGMMVACNKDNNEDNNGNNGGNGGNEPATPTYGDPVINVNFNGADQGALVVTNAMYNSSYGITVFDFAVDAQGTFPMVEIYTRMTEPGQGTSTLNGQNLEGDPAICEFYEQATLRDENGYTYGDWWAKSASINITNYDMTEGYVSFTVEATMFSALEAFVGDNAVGVEAATTAPMTVSAKDIKITTAK